MWFNTTATSSWAAPLSDIQQRSKWFVSTVPPNKLANVWYRCFTVKATLCFGSWMLLSWSFRKCLVCISSNLIQLWFDWESEKRTVRLILMRRGYKLYWCVTFCSVSCDSHALRGNFKSVQEWWSLNLNNLNGYLRKKCKGIKNKVCLMKILRITICV